MTRKGTRTNQMQIEIPDWARTVNFHCEKYYREYDSLGILVKFGRRGQGWQLGFIVQIIAE